MIFLLGLSLLAIVNINGQGLLCEESAPFCTGSIYTFPAGTTGAAQPGAYYGCLTTQPAPAWYHMLIDNPGMIQIYMFSQPSVDIDFICWGPFTDPFEPCVQGLTSSTVVDCSYSPNPTEYCDIPNGQTGQYYILLITNYSQQPCEITFSQTAGAGSTDCTILPPPVGNNGPLCVGDTLHLYAETVPNASYYWSGPAGFLSTQQNPVIPNVTSANAGNYQCVITVNGQSSDPALTSVVIYSLPTANLASNDTLVCVEEAIPAILQFTGWGPFKVTYNDGSNTFLATGLMPPQDTIFLYPTEPTTYTFTKVEDLHCQRNLLFTDIVADTYPVTSGTLSGSGDICAGEPAVLTFDLTGTPPWNLIYTINGGNAQNIAANTSPYVLSVFPTVNTTYALISVEDTWCSGIASGEAVFSVDPSPVSNAGTDQTIPYGTSTTLNGQVSGGSGSYSYSWQPANKLVNPNIQQPTTINLQESTVFTLTGTDNTGGCYDLDEVMVTITGGPLGCFPTANPPSVCAGETSQLQSMANGGSGNYTFQWTSIPPGFSSTLPNPVVNPNQNTTYNVVVSDGFNVINGSTTVNLYERPIPEAGTDVTILHGTTAILQGYASGGSGSYFYHWEPAELLVNPNVPGPQTLNIYSTTLFSLYVTDQTYGCDSDGPDQVTVVVSGDALAINPTAVPDEICFGESTQLFALAGGGSGNYTYQWTSTAGYSSIDANPVVTPPITGPVTYNCVVNDGFNSFQASVAVNVHDVPYIDLGFSDTTVCVNDTLILDAGNDGSTYYWSNGSSQRMLEVATTGIGFDFQSYTVTVTDQFGCSSQESVNVAFDFSACTGVDDEDVNNFCRIYPNPGNGTIHILFDAGTRKAEVSVINMLGQKILEPITFHDLELNGNEIRLAFKDQPEGVYFIRVINSESVSFTYKYILRK